MGKEIGVSVQDCAASTIQDVLQTRIQSVLQEQKSITQEVGVHHVLVIVVAIILFLMFSMNLDLQN